MPDFELSIENPLTFKSYIQDYIGEIATEINRVADGLKQHCFKLTEMARKQELETGWDGKKILPLKQIEYAISNLTQLKDKADTFWKEYIDRSV